MGDEILVAPVLEEGKTARNIYLPEGKWIDQKDGQTHQGPLWLNNYAAPLDVLPYFVKIGSSGSERLFTMSISFVIFFVGLINFSSYFM